jgi:hypothetical protein
LAIKSACPKIAEGAGRKPLGGELPLDETGDGEVPS